MNTHTHMGDDTMDCNDCTVDICPNDCPVLIERCDYCDNFAITICELCWATLCNDHIEHDAQLPMNTYETIMAMQHAVTERARKNVDAHMTRYIANRNKRTGQTWTVIDRYCTDGHRKRVASNDDCACHDRAVIENEHGKRIRIFHDMAHWRVA